MTVNYGFTDTRFGICFIALYHSKVCYLGFSDDLPYLLSKMSWAKDFVATDVTEIAREIFENRPSVELFIDHGTPFQRRVWQALLAIQRGEMVSYGELAARCGMPLAVRAVASAVARNPISYLIPCHRVIRSDGSLGQYHWGVERKRAILEFEKNNL